MHTTRKLLGQVRRALLAALLLAGFANLLQLALPFYALHVFESALPAASLETVGLLALIAVGAGLTLVALVAARDRIVLRAGLWLDHTLGQHILENGARLGTPPAEIARSAAALARFTSALSDRSVVAMLEAPWLPLLLAAMALLHPIMGAVAGVSALLLMLATLAQAGAIGRLARQAAEAGERGARWWSASPTDGSLPPEAADQWERLNRAHIATAYALGKRSVILTDLARLVRVGAQVALIAVGAWLVLTHALSPAALFACILVNVALLEPLERLVAALPAVRAAATAYRHLRALPADAKTARSDPADPIFASSEPDITPAPRRLNIGGPLAVGLAAALLFIAAGLGAAYARLGDLAGLAGGAIFETRLTPLHYPKVGAGARVHVREGANVKAGDLIITRDTGEVDQQIVMLKAQAEAVRAQLALIGQETSVVAQPGEPAAPDRPKLASLESRVGSLEKETQELLSRIAHAEQELAKSEIRAPVSGRVVALNVHRDETAGGAEGIELEIATSDRPLLERLLDPVLRGLHASVALQVGSDAKEKP